VICQHRSTKVEYDHQTAEGAAMGMIRQRKATDQQKEFVQYLVRENKKPTEADLTPGDIIYIPTPLEKILNYILE